MKHLKVFIYLHILLLALTSCSKIKVDIINYGEIKATAPVGKVEAAKSHSGYINLMHENESPVFMQSEEVHAAIGKRFGINVLISGKEFGEIVNLITRVTHPAFSNGQTVDQWDSPLNVGITRYTGWLFETEQELVSGKWTFEILDSQDNVLATKEFNVVVKKQ